ncbi:MAG: helix-turn-helix transcriptional regulator [Muribaculaceae bacterium]|nr:helix-turn-helix transcriptional regulator [Muribaculaceae bacterium]
MKTINYENMLITEFGIIVLAGLLIFFIYVFWKKTDNGFLSDVVTSEGDESNSLESHLAENNLRNETGIVGIPTIVNEEIELTSDFQYNIHSVCKGDQSQFNTTYGELFPEHYDDKLSENKVRRLLPNEIDFVRNVEGLIRESVDSPDFNISLVYKKMGMSRSLFFSKFKRITGMTPYSIMINERMKHAALLLSQQPHLSITEVSDRSGFTSPVYFSRSFKKQFGISPFNYRKKAIENPDL